MNQENKDFLLEELAVLEEEVPPMPADFHQQWMKKVEEDSMPAVSKKSLRPIILRTLSAAAALVFVVSGALFAMDEMEMALQHNNGAMNRSVSLTTEEYDTASYSMGAPEVNSAAGGMMLTARKAASEQKKIIRTASMTIVTQAFQESLDTLKDLCDQQGGWMESISESTAYDGLRTAYMTMRIPSDALDAYMAGSVSAGRITRRNESAQDVTTEYQDTAAQLATQQALMARLQALITDTANLSELLELESQIADTQYTIDRLQSSLNNTDRQVDYATVDVTLREEELTAQTEEITLLQRLELALSEGWDAFLALMEDAAVFLVSALPFMLIVAGLYVIWRIGRRLVNNIRKRRK